MITIGLKYDEDVEVEIMHRRKFPNLYMAWSNIECAKDCMIRFPPNACNYFLIIIFNKNFTLKNLNSDKFIPYKL